MSLRVSQWIHLAAAASVLVIAGCAEEPSFRLNTVHQLTLEREFLDGESIPEEHIQQIGTILTAMFGTPNDPHFPAGYHDIVDLAAVEMAAGPVSSEMNAPARGLYRKNCVHCHGISGDGTGPTAPFLNPYPRDFRMGRYKFKSTKMYRPPTDEDLKRILERGIVGTAMPSFALLGERELNALVEYVKYLSIRGQVERALLEEATYLEKGEDLLAQKGTVPDDEYQYQLELLMEVVESVLSEWRDPEDEVIPVPSLPSAYGRRRPGLALYGKRLFFGKANCAQCHGDTGLGDGQTENYDDWTNEWLKRGNVDLNDPSDLAAYEEAGALPPRKIRPRNLRRRILRGGNLPADLFRRIRGGVEGTSMPAAPALTDDEVWWLVAYILELPYASDLKDREGR